MSSRTVPFVAIFVLVASTCGLPTTKLSPGEFGDHFQGDIILRPESFIGIKSGIIGEQYRWPSAVVPYVIDENFDKQDRLVILTALAHLEKHTCLRFVDRWNEANYVYVNRGEEGSGYFSEVGKVGGDQILNLEPNLVEDDRLGTVVHEFIHAVGYFHEQSRTDRDDYVTINYANIRPGYEHNFDKYTAEEVDSHGITYDYDSIMHYGAYGFAIDPEVPTIIVPEGVTIGQRDALSAKDIQKLNAMYCES